MKKLIEKTLLTAAACGMAALSLAVSCQKIDETALNDRIDAIEDRLDALEADFKARLSELASLEPEAKLAAILTLEADYFRQSDYLNEAGHDLIGEINQVKNQTLSDLTQEVEFDA